MFESGKFFVGCNYWASHAGIYMWRNWNAEQVEQDLATLEKNGLQVIRMFLTWPDFQPLNRMYGGGCSLQEMRHGDKTLPDTEFGRAGLDPVMMERFKFYADCAYKHNLKLIVGLITGWMSGRMLIPPAFEGKNLHTDPEVIRWQVRFVRCFVRTFKDHPAIAGWNLGNECNCMAEGTSNPAAWNWINTITSAIRLEDPTRPVVSGMHGLQCSPYASWTIADQAELTDILTTHPYPIFTPHSGIDRVNTFRNVFHAAAESRLYADAGNRPCFPEEAGNLGPMMSGPETAAAYLRNMLWNSYAHDCRGLLWWCAFDQDWLPFPPYDWVAMERELGLVDHDGQPKLTLQTMAAFRKMTESVGTLPEFRKDAVMILPHSDDIWGTAWAAFLLAKQAGFDIRFCRADQTVPEADFYIIPGVADFTPFTAEKYKEILAKVEKGATLFVTLDGGVLQPFAQVFGVEFDYREEAPAEISIPLPDGTTASWMPKYRSVYKNVSADVILKDAEGLDRMFRKDYGKGQVIYLGAAPEPVMGNQLRAFVDGASPVWKLYAIAAEIAGVKRILKTNDPQVTVTEHPVSENEVIVILVNNRPEECTTKCTLADGWTGDIPAAIPGNDGCIVRLTRK